MAGFDPKADFRRYLQQARDAVLWKLDGLPEYDLRRPLVPTGTNLLGLVKHLTGVELGYFGATFGRPSPDEQPWSEDDPMSDMFAAADESRAQIIGRYKKAWVPHPSSPVLRPGPRAVSYAIDRAYRCRWRS